MSSSEMHRYRDHMRQVMGLVGPNMDPGSKILDEDGLCVMIVVITGVIGLVLLRFINIKCGEKGGNGAKKRKKRDFLFEKGGGGIPAPSWVK